MSLATQLLKALGPDQVTVDSDDLHYYSMDIYGSGVTPTAVIFPSSVEDLQEGVRVTTSHDGVVVPRGGGISYTGGVVPSADRSVVIDTLRMNRVLDVAQRDMYVTVEAGCTWGRLRESLAEQGLRTPFWGPLSGNYATVGGTVSQGSVLWGSSRFGTSSDSVLGLEVVVADGSLLTTGMASIEGARPGWRHFGPDLTGIFLGDTGALGVKATVTLRLMQTPQAAGFASFLFDDRHDLIDAMGEIARAGLIVAGFALDPILTDQRIRRGSLAQGAEAVRSMIGSSRNKLRALKDAARMASRGRGFVGRDKYTLHLIAEGRSTESVEDDLRDIERICAAGSRIDNTIPKLLYTRPFGSLTSALGPEGQRWSPLHVLVPLSDGNGVWDAIDDLVGRYRDRMDALDVELGFMSSTVSTTSMLLETVMTWPGPRTAFYERNIDAGKLRRFPNHPRSPEAEALVKEMRDELVTLFAEVGGAHFQIGRRYGYLDRLDPAARALLMSVKRAVDPHNRMNPGALGIG